MPFTTLLFGLEWSMGFTLPTGISWEQGREGEEEGEGGVYKWPYFYWYLRITWNLWSYVYEKYTFNRTAIGMGEEDYPFWGLLNNGCILAWAAWNNPPVWLLCHPIQRAFLPGAASALAPAVSGHPSCGTWLWTKVGQMVLPGCWQEQGEAVKMGFHSAQGEEDQGWGKPLKTKELEVK